MSREALLLWQEPPESSTGKNAGVTKWRYISTTLRSRPGEWALVATDMSPGTVNNIKRGKLSGMTIGEFEAVSRSRPDSPPGKADIYARYIGPKGTS